MTNEALQNGTPKLTTDNFLMKRAIIIGATVNKATQQIFKAIKDKKKIAYTTSNQ